jgi:hypothetical protein
VGLILLADYRMVERADGGIILIPVRNTVF